MPKITKYNGGYVIISLNDEDIYEKIERNLYKPILLTDIVINGIEKNDVFTTAYVEGTNIVFKDIYDKDITISNDNSVSIGDNGKHLYEYVYTHKDNTICFKAFLLTNKSDLNMNNLANFFNENIDLEFQACGYEYVNSEALVINSIYYDGDAMWITNVHKNSNGEIMIGEDYFQIAGNDSLVKRQIF